MHPFHKATRSLLTFINIFSVNTLFMCNFGSCLFSCYLKVASFMFLTSLKKIKFKAKAFYRESK